ncbi:unnamed protein product [Nippostrongylus brasiliensis]|uniref:Secreted protein n=1 Tax=Nippostrongylus brasiliensis TaxID=27835 RepID=A0A0N4YYI0_NIPBR|nr:unnamed protein product [Nippostrongylus brasiliensis]
MSVLSIVSVMKVDRSIDRLVVVPVVVVVVVLSQFLLALSVCLSVDMLADDDELLSAVSTRACVSIRGFVSLSDLI